MHEHPYRHFLDFELPLKTFLEKQAPSLTATEAAIQAARLKATLTAQLTPWQTIQLSRHPNRPHMLDYIRLISSHFTELHGDRCYSDDKALIGGMATFEGRTILFIGHQKGRTTSEIISRNYGMPQPGGYRKALRLMKLAEKFNIPIITLIDTPGADPGAETHTHGGGEAIARNLFEMMRLQVPVIAVIIGEGGSGGAMGIGVGDRLLMQQHTYCSVVSPESCSAILWRNGTMAKTAAEQLQLTASHLLHWQLIDAIIPEPAGGAHWDTDAAAALLKENIATALQEVCQIPAAQRITDRINKYASYGIYEIRDGQ